MKVCAQQNYLVLLQVWGWSESFLLTGKKEKKRLGMSAAVY